MARLWILPLAVVLALAAVAAWQFQVQRQAARAELDRAMQMQQELRELVEQQGAPTGFNTVQRRLEHLERKLMELASKVGDMKAAGNGIDANDPGLDGEPSAVMQELAAEVTALREELMTMQQKQGGSVENALWTDAAASRIMFQNPQDLANMNKTNNGSNPGALRWDVDQFLGEPDSPAGDQPTAWASKDPDGGEEWLEVEFATAVRPDTILIRETYNPGAVVRVDAMDSSGKWKRVWSGSDPTKSVPSNFEVPGPSFATQVVRVILDTTLVPGWNEIDAIGLVSGGQTQWAVAGSASSSYAERYDQPPTVKE